MTRRTAKTLTVSGLAAALAAVGALATPVAASAHARPAGARFAAHARAHHRHRARLVRRRGPHHRHRHGLLPGVHPHGAHPHGAQPPASGHTGATPPVEIRPTGAPSPTGRGVGAPQVPDGPCPNADLEPMADNLAAINKATLCLINKERVARGLAALAENSKLDAAAQHHSDDMIANQYFDHVSPSGEGPMDRIRASGYLQGASGYEIGENIATGSRGLDTPAQVVAAWMDSAGHRANILHSAFTETGLAAVAAMPSSGYSGATYTQDFGAVTS